MASPSLFFCVCVCVFLPLLATLASYISTFLVVLLYSIFSKIQNPTENRPTPNYVLPPTTSLAVYL